MSASSPLSSKLPPKLYFRIGEVAGLVGVEPHVLRYWEREFRSIRPTKSAKGQRVYSRRDVENLMRVRELLYAEGFTIAGAKKKLQRGGTEPPPVEADDGAGLDVKTTLESSFAASEPSPPVASPASSRGAHAYPPFSSSPSSPSSHHAYPSPKAREGSAEAAATASPAGRSAPMRGEARVEVRTDPRMREALTALRREVEAFLAELGG